MVLAVKMIVSTTLSSFAAKMFGMVGTAQAFDIHKRRKIMLSKKVLSIVLAITIMGTSVTPVMAAETSAPEEAAVAMTETEEASIPAEENTTGDQASEEEENVLTEGTEAATAQGPEDIVTSEQENDSVNASEEEGAGSDTASEDATVTASEDAESEETAEGMTTEDEGISEEPADEEAVSDEDDPETGISEEVNDKNNAEETASEDTDLSTPDESSDKNIDTDAADQAASTAPEEAVEEAMEKDKAVSGICGEKAVWSLTEADGEFILTISGTGLMDDYEQALNMDSGALEDTSTEDTALGEEGGDLRGDWSKAPWYDVRDRVTAVVVEEGISAVGSYAFSGFSSLKEVILPSSVKILGEHCFDQCDMLSCIIVPESVSEVRDIAFGEEGTSIHIFYRGTEDQWKNAVGENRVYFGSITYDYIDSETAEAIQEDEGVKDTGLVQKDEGSQDTIGSAQEKEDTQNAAATETITAKETATQAKGAGQKISQSTKNSKTAKTAKVGQKTTVKKKQRIKGTSITKLIPGENKVTIKWKKRTKNIDGYQIEYATNRKFKNKKQIIVWNNVWTTGTEEISKLESGKKYYFRIRTIYEGKKSTLYSSWSQMRSTRVKAPKSNFKLSKTGIRMGCGVSRKMTAKNKKTGKKEKVKWKSSNKWVASVNKNGKIKAKSPGIAIITACSVNDKKSRCTVIVTVVPAPTKYVKAKNEDGGILVTWKKVKGADGYYVYRNGKKHADVYGESTVKFFDTENTDSREPVSNGKKYTYKIVAYADAGSGIPSKSSTIYRIEMQYADIKEAGYQTIHVSWEKNIHASGYEVQYGYRWDFKGGTKTILINDGKKESTIIKGFKEGKTCVVRVRAYKKVGKKKYDSNWREVGHQVLKKGKTDNYNYSFETVGALLSGLDLFCVVKTNNPDFRSFRLVFIDKNGNSLPISIRLGGYDYDDLELTSNGNDITSTCIAVLKDGYVIPYYIDKPGEYSVYIDETLSSKTTRTYVGNICVTDYSKAYHKWIDSIISKATTNSMSKEQKMEAICKYLSENTKYYKTYIDSDGEERLLNLAADQVTPDFMRMEFDSYTSPMTLVDFGKRIGYPLESMYFDYPIGSVEWSNIHWYAINRKTGKRYEFCSSSDSNLHDINSIKKITTVQELKDAYYKGLR